MGLDQRLDRYRYLADSSLRGAGIRAYRATKGRRPRKADRVLLTGLPLMECRVSKANRPLKSKAGHLFKVGRPFKVGRAFPMGPRLTGRRVSSAVVLR
ncbi:hypothetical protein [Streptomyces prunicolor]